MTLPIGPLRPAGRWFMSWYGGCLMEARGFEVVLPSELRSKLFARGFKRLKTRSRKVLSSPMAGVGRCERRFQLRVAVLARWLGEHKLTWKSDSPCGWHCAGCVVGYEAFVRWYSQMACMESNQTGPPKSTPYRDARMCHGNELELSTPLRLVINRSFILHV